VHVMCSIQLEQFGAETHLCTSCVDIISVKDTKLLRQKCNKQVAIFSLYNGDTIIVNMHLHQRPKPQLRMLICLPYLIYILFLSVLVLM